MPIEFNCTQCGNPLRTPDGTQGRQAKCPQCGAVMQIPFAASAAPPPAPATGSPFAPGPQAGEQQGWNPYASPSIGGESAQQRTSSVGELVPTRVDFGRSLSATWAIFKANMSICLLTGLTLCVVHVVFNFISSAISSALGGAVNFAPGRAAPNIDLGSVVIAQIVIQLIGWVAYTWLQMGTIRCFLRIARGEPASVGDIFSGGPYLLRGMLINLIFFVTGLIGAILAFAAMAAGGGDLLAFFAVLAVLAIVNVVIYLSVSQSFAAVVDRDMPAIDGIKTSISVMSGNRLTLFLLFLVVGIVGGLFSLVTCFIGFVAVVPYIGLLQAVFYLQCTGQRTSEFGPP
ncbi:MAG: hypothetical protein DCC68_04215 [Planctomycetota bacterium]|nr:MAG: hypothetical protein DCC68_04215 [Planctomycetota bacterium]